MSLREIGREVGISNAGTVKYYLDKLINQGVLVRKKKNAAIQNLRKQIIGSQGSIAEIPVLGAANCGLATIFAEEHLEGYLKISKHLLRTTTPDTVFALRAEGNSMNKAHLNGKSIEDGDYILIDTNFVNLQNGDYVLSIIDGAANIKKFHNKGEMIVLKSESTETHPPIYIHQNDTYLVNGKVIQVIKQGGD